jgi:predicted transcriptional regulator
MKKRRVTLNLDEDVVEALESLGGRSLSASANRALRQAVATEAHRAALGRWLDELDAVHGVATPEQASTIAAFLDELVQPTSGSGVA